MMMRILSLILVFSTYAWGGIDPSNKFKLGDGAASDKTIEANKGAGSANPKIKWSDSGSTWQFSNNGTTFTDFGSGGLPENPQTGTTYTFVLGDSGKIVSLTNASPVTATVPPNSSVAFPLGTVIDVIAGGAGAVSLAEGSGVTINSKADSLTLSAQYSEARLVKFGTNSWWLYGDLVGSFITATGGTITTDGNFKVHTFTSSGTFTVTAGSGMVEYLVVAGGGGGGNASANSSGGGGAGGVLVGSQSVSPNAYTVTVGAGGAPSTSGNNSVFDTITATGGGAGSPGNTTGVAGGSGGGGSGNTAAHAGGAGTVGQGFAGGTGSGSNGGGGGGGKGGVGADGSGTTGGNGGPGYVSSISGSSVTYASGGGGGGSGAGGTAPAGGGGNGGGATGSNATANTGGGGGGGGTGGSGGSGVVIIRYQFQ